MPNLDSFLILSFMLFHIEHDVSILCVFTTYLSTLITTCRIESPLDDLKQRNSSKAECRHNMTENSQTATVLYSFVYHVSFACTDSVVYVLSRRAILHRCIASWRKKRQVAFSWPLNQTTFSSAIWFLFQLLTQVVSSTTNRSRVGELDNKPGAQWFW